MYAGFSVLNGLAHMDSELDYGINLWLTVSLVGISRCCLLFSFCITLHTLMYIIFIIQNIYITPSMNGIARHHIAIKQLYLFSITYYVIYYSFSSHSIIIMQILFNYTFNIVSTTNCNSKIYDLFVKLINHFKIYSLTTLIFIFYPSLNLTPFLFLYYLLSYFMYICPFWRVTFSSAIQYIFVLNYHMSITYAYAYIIVYTKTLDSLLYYFIFSNQSFL